MEKIEDEEYLKSREISVSENFKRYCSEGPVTEYDIIDGARRCEIYGAKVVIGLEDYDLVKKYFKPSNFQVKIENEEDYKRLLELVGNEKTEIIFNKKGFEAITNSGIIAPQNVDFYFEVQNMTEVTQEELRAIAEKIDIKSVHIQEDGDPVEEKDCYLVEKYCMIKDKIDSILKGLGDSESELDKFMKIYTYLGESISYEFTDDGEPSDRIETCNLEGGLLEGKSICEGYSKILRQVLRASGIDCKYLVGMDYYLEGARPIDDNHGWNQVKIDGKWYNCDLTWDSIRIQDKRPLEYCLKSDEDFTFHITKSPEKEKCDESYDIVKVNSYLSYDTDLEFEEKSELFTIGKDTMENLVGSLIKESDLKQAILSLNEPEKDLNKEVEK